MKKVLIVSYYYPPRPSIASNRIGGLAKYLSYFGWEPTILTTKIQEGKWLPHIKVFETEGILTNKNNSIPNYSNSNSIINKIFVYILNRIRMEYSAYPDNFRLWVPLAVDMGRRILKENQFSAIISSSAPVSTHLIANSLCTNSSIPWIADFRDLWTQNHNYPYSILRRFLECKLEIETLKNAAGLVTVSEPLVDKMKLLHKNKRVYCITNGFDHEEICNHECHSNKFIITYTGQIYRGKQDPILLFQALSELFQEGLINRRKIEVRFFGPRSERLQNLINKYALEKEVIQYGIVSRDISLSKQRESTVLLLLNWNDCRERGIYTGKIFEYLAAKKPILALGGGDGVVKELLDSTQSGLQPSIKKEVKEIILRWYKQFIESKKIDYNGKMHEIEKYTHVCMAEKFANILNSISQ